MERWRPIMLLSLAIVIGLIASVLTYRWLQKGSPGSEKTPAQTLEIATALVDLNWGTVIQETMIKMTPFLYTSLPPGSFSDAKSLRGRVLIYPVKANEPILESRLASIDVKTGGVAPLISPDKRAMAVKVDKVIGVSGFIFPGHRIDVLVTVATTEKESAQITKTVLENILVLAVGSEVKEQEKDKPATVDVITLEVTPEEAEKLGLAASQGRLQLALRNPTDTKDVLTRGVKIPNLLASYTPGYEAVKAGKKVWRATPEKKAFTVELIKGNTVITQKF